MDIASSYSNLRAIVTESHLVGTILDRCDLPECCLSGSAIAQTAWNAAFGLPPEHGPADIDLVYFDDANLSEEREPQQAPRIRGLFPDLPMWIDAKNEAGIHLCIEAKFDSQAPRSVIALAVSHIGLALSDNVAVLLFWKAQAFAHVDRKRQARRHLFRPVRTLRAAAAAISEGKMAARGSAVRPREPSRTVTVAQARPIPH